LAVERPAVARVQPDVHRTSGCRTLVEFSISPKDQTKKATAEVASFVWRAGGDEGGHWNHVISLS
jgi:hypothetical protein